MAHRLFCMNAREGKGRRPARTGRVAKDADIKSPPRVAHTLFCMYALVGTAPVWRTGSPIEGADAKNPPRRIGASQEGDAYFTVLNRFSISAQFTTFHQAVMYSARRFWYLR